MPKYRDDDKIKALMKEEEPGLAAGDSERVSESVPDAPSLPSPNDEPDASDGSPAKESAGRNVASAKLVNLVGAKRDPMRNIRIREETYFLLKAYNDYLEESGESRRPYVGILDECLRLVLRKQGKDLRKYLHDRGFKI